MKRLQEQIIANSPGFYEATHDPEDLKISASAFLSRLGEEDVAMEEEQVYLKSCKLNTEISHMKL